MMNDVPPEGTEVPQEDTEDALASFERAITGLDQPQHYCLRLYIAGATPHSIAALENLKAICETYLQGQYELEVIDVYQSAQTLQTDHVVAVPTLIKQLPLPLRQIIGDLSNTDQVLLGLNLIPK